MVALELTASSGVQSLREWTGTRSASALHSVVRPPLRGHALVLVLEMLDGLVGVHVEDRLADGQPLPALIEEHRRGVPQVTDGGQPFHVAPLDRLELNGDADEGDDLPGLPSADELDLIVPLALLPAQAARLAAGGGGAEKAALQALALELEQLASPFQMEIGRAHV